ncbi:carbohydrate porin [Telmatospirillum sp.]|uniref:carbohydrate porin n=1 Tax=Telmatospirillum sp. TaxID=2079197 RepID=UPI0028437347|nr:carbohydrate porin [Telmatospirillum sp.]MDR3439588.1 carbohydrate porin [Telmatospirillum sp.]
MKTALLAGVAAIALSTLSLPAMAEDAAAPTGLWERDTLTGDWEGVRTKLIDHGVTLGLKYTGEVFDTPSGGIRHGGVYEDQFLLTGDFDLEKLAGLTGSTAHVSAFSVNGRGPSVNNVGNNMDVSGVELYRQRQTRLWTLWYQLAAADSSSSVRIGQISVDDEFFLSTTSANLLNTTFVWNALGYNNLSGGTPNRYNLTNGPAYPLGAPGVRVQFNPSDNIAWLSAITTHQPESFDRGGAQFRVDGNVFMITELQYLENQAKDATGKPVAYKIGAWYDTGKFADPHYDTTGQSLASPLSNGRPQQRNGTWAIYGVADRTVWQSESGQAVSVFLRGGVAPDSYNLVNAYVDGGVGYKGIIPGRESDILTFGVAYANAGDGAVDYDNDVRRFNQANTPVRDYETVLELNYTANVAPWWTVQPDVQYVIHPGLGGVNSLKPGTTIPDATVFGLRTTITF